MLKLNKDRKGLKIINPTAFIALISAATLAFSGCSSKKIEKNNIDTDPAQELFAEETVTEPTKYSTVVRTDWSTYNASVQDLIDSKAKNSMSKENLETALLLLNFDYLYVNDLSILDSYYKNSGDIDQNDEMNQLYKLLSLVREYNTNTKNINDYISYENLLLNIDANNQNDDYKVVSYLESKVKGLISNPNNLTDEIKLKDFKEIKEFANGTGTICGLYQVDLTNDAIIATENIMQQYSILSQNFVSYEERAELDKILNSHNYLYNVEMNMTKLNGYARPVATAEESLKIKENVLNQRTKGYDDVKFFGVTEEEYNSLFAIANIDYFMRDVNNSAVFSSIYGSKADIDNMFINAETAVQKIESYNLKVTNKEELYDYGHLYVSSVNDILNTRYVVNLTFDIANNTNDFNSSAAKLKLYNQYSEELSSTTYTYENETYRIGKNTLSEGATQINNWISYYTYVVNRTKFNDDKYVDNMISLVNGSVDGLNPYDEIVLMVTDFCANKNEGTFQYKIGELK